MPQPTQSDVHVNRPLSNLSIAQVQDETDFIATKVFKNIPVEKQSDVYFKFDPDNWFRTEAQIRAAGTESAGSGYTLTTDSYYAPVIAVHKDVYDQVRGNQDQPLDQDAEATAFVTRQLLLKRELDFVSNYFTTSVWTGSTTGTDITPGTLWSASGSTPIENIRAQIQAMKGLTGLKPNKLVLGQQVWTVLQDHAEFLDRVKYGGTNANPGRVVSPQMLADILELDEVLVASAVKNTAKEGAANSLSFMYGKNALLVHAPATAGKMTAAAGYTFSWNQYASGLEGNRISKFRMEWLKSDRVEGEMAYAMKVVAPQLGCFFSGAVA